MPARPAPLPTHRLKATRTGRHSAPGGSARSARRVSTKRLVLTPSLPAAAAAWSTSSTACRGKGELAVSPLQWSWAGGPCRASVCRLGMHMSLAWLKFHGVLARDTTKARQDRLAGNKAGRQAQRQGVRPGRRPALTSASGGRSTWPCSRDWCSPRSSRHSAANSRASASMAASLAALMPLSSASTPMPPTTAGRRWRPRLAARGHSSTCPGSACCSCCCPCCCLLAAGSVARNPASGAGWAPACCSCWRCGGAAAGTGEGGPLSSPTAPSSSSRGGESPASRASMGRLRRSGALPSGAACRCTRPVLPLTSNHTSACWRSGVATDAGRIKRATIVERGDSTAGIGA